MGLDKMELQAVQALPSTEQIANGANDASGANDGRDGLLLQSRDGLLLSEGVRAVVAAPAARLGDAVAHHFAKPRAGDAGVARLAGALPFDRAANAHLLAPRVLHAAPAAAPWLQRMAAHGAMNATWSLDAQPSRAQYEAAVARCLPDLHAPGALSKVVLARTLLARSARAVNPWWLVQRLAGDPGVMRYVVPLPVATGEAPAWLVGATPELLLSRRGARIVSEPLAGSAPRLADDAASQARADALRGSAKDHQEHRYVVQAIADTLAPLCRQLRVPDVPALHATATMWHLGTRIEGELKDASPEALAHNGAAALAALLHPTPAVCGTPREEAARRIAALEPVPRGFYAGAVGWCDAHGDGDWHVALRCARVQGHEARLFAGAGIVADSIPESEGAETRAKFNAMLNALGVDAAALPSDL